jgi:hypothetical protein
MGLLDFVKSVGTKIFGAPEPTEPPPDRLRGEIDEHGIEVSDDDAWSEETEQAALAIDDPPAVAAVRDVPTSSDSAPDWVETEDDEIVLSESAASPEADAGSPGAIAHSAAVGTAKDDLTSPGHEPES